ncbi:hypothetical protein CASFOL_004326 [Castilleja foliolosa]|uniref:Pentatricopeptide repeat-containing protein n=1 Tax=Castilleja foliolosa TaxID=1961234 RepID=A0ABD3EDX1_9LAMI
MESLSFSLLSYPISNQTGLSKSSPGMIVASRSNNKNHNHKKTQQLPKNLLYRRRTEVPPDSYPVLYPVKETETDSDYDDNEVNVNLDDNVIWEPDEIEAISSLFQGRVPQKPGNLNRERPSPLPLPYKTRPLGFPTSKKIIRTQPARSNRQPVTNLLYKNPTFLITLARDIRSLPCGDGSNNNDDVSLVLDQWARFLRKGSLSLTIRELGHMGLPGRALHVFNWVQKQPHLFPDDRVLASTVEVLARAHELKMPFDSLDRFIALASRPVYEAMVKGFVKGGNTRLALRLISTARESKRTLDPSVYAKLILEIWKNPDKRTLVLPLLEELANRDDLKLSQQDCTAIMKVCSKLGRFDLVEALYDWFKKCGGVPSVVMYTTLIHSRCLEGKYREGMSVVWEMEGLNCLLDLPAYRVVIKLFVVLNDLSRTSRYFAKLKESGFKPTYDIYRDVIGVYMVAGRLAKCKEIRHEAEMAGYMLDELLQG